MKFVHKRYAINSTLNLTSDSFIQFGIDTHTGLKVAIKLELRDLPFQSLSHESNMLEDLQGGPGIPTLYSHGRQGCYNYMILEYLGDSLHKAGWNSSLSSILSYMDQTLRSLKYIHSKEILHRNIQPSNLILGRKSHKMNIYIVNYRDAIKCSLDNSSTSHSSSKSVASPYFASLNALSGFKQSYRDDLESLCYCMI